MKLFYLAALYTAFILTSCSTEKIWLNKLQAGSVPTDVKSSKLTLLVEKPTWSKAEMKELEKCMAEDYPGKFEIIPIEDLKLAKYADSTKYRYFLKRNPNGYVSETSANAPQGSNASAEDKKFWAGIKDKKYVADQIFVDRKLNKELPSTGMRMSSFSWPVKFLVHHIQTM